MRANEFGRWRRSKHVTARTYDWTVSTSRWRGGREKKKILAGSVALETGARDRRLRQALGTVLRQVVRHVAFFFSSFFPPHLPCFLFLLYVFLLVNLGMGRQSRRKQHLKQLNAAKSKAASHLPPTEDKESSSSDHEVLWSDEELDRHPEVTIKKLFNSAQNIVPSKRPFGYTSNSISQGVNCKTGSVCS